MFEYDVPEHATSLSEESIRELQAIGQALQLSVYLQKLGDQDPSLRTKAACMALTCPGVESLALNSVKSMIVALILIAFKAAAAE